MSILATLVSSHSASVDAKVDDDADAHDLKNVQTNHLFHDDAKSSNVDFDVAMANHDEEQQVAEPESNDNKSSDLDDDEKNLHAVSPITHKIVQDLTYYGMREMNFASLDEATAYWNSLTYLVAAIWYEYDAHRKIWNIKDSYGPAMATHKICAYVEDKYNGRSPKQKAEDTAHLAQKKSSVMSYLSLLLSTTESDNNNDTIAEKNHALLDEWLATTKRFTQLQISGLEVLDDLDVDNKDCNDLIVCMLWKAGVQCFFVPSFELSQQTWNKLPSWYSSVWFVRNTMGIFVVHDTFGTNAMVRNICRFVNTSQENWVQQKPQTEDTTVTSGQSIATAGGDVDETEDGSHQQCIVCFDGMRDHIIIPCGHIVVCEKCKELYSEQNATCPVCRISVEKVIKIFH